ncbi:phosphate-selective porin [Bradyrhizobium sp. USDA 4369]
MGGIMDAPWMLDEATSSNDILFMERTSSQVIAARIAAGRQTIYTAGLNWHVSAEIRFMVARQARATSTANTGSKFDAVGLRTQVAF